VRPSMSFRTRLRPVKRACARPLEFFWRACFTLAGKLRQPRARAWASDGGLRVLIVAPHADDEAIGCSGTALRHVIAGDRVTVAIATDGRQSMVIPQAELMAQRRRAEATEAARLMRATELRWLGLREGEWCIPQLHEVLVELLATLRPDIVYAPSRVDFHPEHHRVAHSLALALESTAAAHRPKAVRVYQVQVPLTTILANVVSDLDAVLDASEDVLRAYASQAGSVECAYRRRRYSARLHRLHDAVEEFWEMPTTRYVELHREAPSRWRDSYRGLRNFPLTDPLAWLVGGTHRRALRRASSAGSP
jgi:LmbE family N-acetylglucosaminyl deacetylase